MSKRRYCFTLHKPDDETAEVLRLAVESDEAPLSYLCYGWEVAPTTGAVHLQGYLELKKKQRMSFIKKLFKRNDVHLEACRGTATQNIEYCRKEGKFVEYGSARSRQGKRSDLEEVKAAIDADASILELFEGHFPCMVRYHRGIEKYMQLRAQRERVRAGYVKPRVSVFYGDTGAGKTRRVYNETSAREGSELWSWPGGQWFDGYDGQDSALFDDFRGELSYGFLLRILDGYPIQVPVKGSHVWFRPKFIYITSNLGPEEWYGGQFALSSEEYGPLERRLDVIFQFTGDTQRQIK